MHWYAYALVILYLCYRSDQLHCHCLLSVSLHHERMCTPASCIFCSCGMSVHAIQHDLYSTTSRCWHFPDLEYTGSCSWSTDVASCCVGSGCCSCVHPLPCRWHMLCSRSSCVVGDSIQLRHEVACGWVGPHTSQLQHLAVGAVLVTCMGRIH